MHYDDEMRLINSLISTYYVYYSNWTVVEAAGKKVKKHREKTPAALLREKFPSFKS